LDSRGLSVRGVDEEQPMDYHDHDHTKCDSTPRRFGT
jgi:hypothetical protein